MVKRLGRPIVASTIVVALWILATPSAYAPRIGSGVSRPIGVDTFDETFLFKTSSVSTSVIVSYTNPDTDTAFLDYLRFRPVFLDSDFDASCDNLLGFPQCLGGGLSDFCCVQGNGGFCPDADCDPPCCRSPESAAPQCGLATGCTAQNCVEDPMASGWSSTTPVNYFQGTCNGGPASVLLLAPQQTVSKTFSLLPSTRYKLQFRFGPSQNVGSSFLVDLCFSGDPEICSNGLDDDCDGLIDAADTGGCTPLAVDLRSFTASPESRKVTLEWTTEFETDNAGFFVSRRNLHSDEVVRLGQGLVPARGDNFQGASYTYVDSTALDGVEYEYTLIDVDTDGREHRHPGPRAVPNPPRSVVRSVSPAYGAGVAEGERIVFQWERGLARRTFLLISADPSFSDPAKLLAVAVPKSRRLRGAGRFVLDGQAARRLLESAGERAGGLYWKVARNREGGRLLSPVSYVRVER